MPDKTGHRYLFVTIDGALFCVFVRIMAAKTTATTGLLNVELMRISQLERHDPFGQRQGVKESVIRVASSQTEWSA